MEAIFDYLVKVSTGLSLICIFYYLVLRRLTFYQWNRVYLLSHGMLCFLLPLVDITAWMRQQQVNEVISTIPSIGFHPAADHEPGIYQSLMFIFVSGVVLLSVKLVIQYFSLHKMKKSAALIHEDGRVRFYKTDHIINPCSFGKSVFVNLDQHDDAELESILQHEIVHVRQKHGIDLVIAELICMLNWYNPFAWLIRIAIRQNLEFIADNKVLDKGYDKTAYQYLLLKVVGLNQFSVANHFSFSNLKNRIIMINRIKSAKFHLTRFLFAVPLLAFILLAFRTEWDRQGQLNPRVASPHKTVDSVPGARPLVIVNGEKKSVDYNISRIPVEQIESMNVFKGRSAEKKYGVEGRNGVIAITLKKGFEAERIKEFERREHPEIERPNDVERIKEFERSEHPETERPNNVERIKELKMAQEQIQRQAAELEEQLRNLQEKRVDMQKEVVEQWDGDQVRIRKEQFEQLEHMKQALHDQSQQQEAMEQQEMINGQGKQLSDLDMKMNTLDQQQVKLRSKLQADMNRLVSDYQKKMEKLNRRKEKLNK